MSPEEHYGLDARASVRLGEKGVAFGKLSAAEQFEERAREMGIEMTLFLKRLRRGNAAVPLAPAIGPQIPHKPRFRYLLIAEEHNSANTSDEMRGRPHFHMLIHEVDSRRPLVVGEPDRALVFGRSIEMERRNYKTRKGWLPGVFAADESFLRSNWKYGHTKFQLATSANSAAYVCKYLTKALRVRVRPSQRYGDESEPSPKDSERKSKVGYTDSVKGDPPPNLHTRRGLKCEED